MGEVGVHCGRIRLGIFSFLFFLFLLVLGGGGALRMALTVLITLLLSAFSIIFLLFFSTYLSGRFFALGGVNGMGWVGGLLLLLIIVVEFCTLRI